MRLKANIAALLAVCWAVAALAPHPALAAWTYPLPDWMSGMRDDVPLADLTMPAAHDAGAESWGQVCIASRGKMKKLCMEVHFAGKRK